LREQREFFQLISESIGEHIAVLDLQGRRLYNSPSYQQFFGPARDLSAAIRSATSIPMTASGCGGSFARPQKPAPDRKSSIAWCAQDGSVRHMASAGKVIRNRQGQTMRVVVVSRDISDRKQAEQWERIAATAFESQQGMFITDARASFCGSTRRSPKSPATPPRRVSAARPGSQFGSPRRGFLSRDARKPRGPAPGKVKSGTGARTTKSSRNG
jgi:hypothetical protein